MEAAGCRHGLQSLIFLLLFSATATHAFVSLQCSLRPRKEFAGPIISPICLPASPASESTGRWISERTIQQVNEHAVLSEVCALHVEVKKSGSTTTSICPFHDDTHPSMSIDDEKNLFHCFSCGAGGNIFTYVREMEGLSFSEAVEFLASMYDIPVEYESRGSNRSDSEIVAAREAREVRRRALKAAESWYAWQLASRPDAGAARAHLSHSGISPESALKWGLGWAPHKAVTSQMTSSTLRGRYSSDQTRDSTLTGYLVEQLLFSLATFRAGFCYEC